MTDRQERPQERFSCGVIHATPNALDALVRNRQNVQTLLARHERAGRRAVSTGRYEAQQKRDERRRSEFTLPDGTRLWIVTEPDRDTTTLLLSEEA